MAGGWKNKEAKSRKLAAGQEPHPSIDFQGSEKQPGGRTLEKMKPGCALKLKAVFRHAQGSAKQSV